MGGSIVQQGLIEERKSRIDSLRGSLLHRLRSNFALNTFYLPTSPHVLTLCSCENKLTNGPPQSTYNL